MRPDTYLPLMREVPSKARRRERMNVSQYPFITSMMLPSMALMTAMGERLS